MAKEERRFTGRYSQSTFGTDTRACLKNAKTPKRRIFSCCAALKILEIHQDSREFLPCPAKKSLAVGHSVVHQTGPEILVDRQTGVNYLFHHAGYAGGLTPLPDRDGRPVVTPAAGEG